PLRSTHLPYTTLFRSTVQVLGGGMHRVMRGIERDVAEEGSPLRAADDEVRRALSQQRGEVLAVAPDLITVLPQVVDGVTTAPVEDVGVVVHAAGAEAEVLVEAVAAGGVGGVDAEVPFAEDPGAVAAVAQ